MEKSISQEERIRRAEEIYSRRRYNNRYGESLYRSGETRNRYQPQETRKIKGKMINKMIIQMIVCVIIYTCIYMLQYSNYLFSKDMVDKTKEVLSYDISIENLYNKSNEFFLNLQKKFNWGVNNEQNDNVNEEAQDQNTEETNIENSNAESSKNTSEANNDNVDNSEISQNDASTEVTNNDTTQLAVGGADETQQEEAKSQEEQDIEYVKQNVSIIWPIKGVITSRFGNRTPTEIVTANHKGLDIAGNMGDNIVSAMDGTVVQYSEEGDYGKHLRIQSGEVLTLYAHCSELLVQEGSTVKQGDVIAKVGATGRATGPHLHFEIRRDDRFINPELILGSL
ncbi:MAG: M23 family metallopeptidase [Clostridium sp.]|jgi:murein DD-endopeptidase MepM/ murein hydrolase activator NlpD|nr:M23 family metallopeptidase [Clostridium sp.]